MYIFVAKSTPNVTASQSTPRKVSKGRYQVELVDDTLILTKGKNQVTIPVGTPTRYQGNNKIEVTLPDCTLQCLVAKFGHNQKRLAEDLAKFISGQGSFPILSQYRIPWILLVMSLLPIGIPIMTLGGALPAGVAGGACAVCFGISSNDKWPIAIRTLLCIAVNVCAYVGIGIFVYFMIQAQQVGPR